MSNSPNDLTAQVVVEFNRRLFRDLSERYGGECTLNELRVLNQIVRCSLDGRTCNVTSLHKVTGIPIPTVSRAVTNLQKDGWLSEERDPTDGRRRIISLNPQTLDLARDSIGARVDWLNEIRENGRSDCISERQKNCCN